MLQNLTGFIELLYLILLIIYFFASETLRAYHQTSSDNNSDRDSRSTSSQRFVSSLGNTEVILGMCALAYIDLKKYN